jgi:hypothetical protein
MLPHQTQIDHRPANNSLGLFLVKKTGMVSELAG